MMINYHFLMELTRITDSNYPEVEQLIALHEQEFGEYARFRRTGLMCKLIDGARDMYFHAVHEDGRLTGFFIYWDLGDSYYIHFIAVFPEMRGQKIGQKILDWVAENLKKPVFLEVDIPFDEITERRANFYKRNGFDVVAVDPHTLSSVRKGEHPLWLMGTKTVDDLEPYLVNIRDIVY